MLKIACTIANESKICKVTKIGEGKNTKNPRKNITQ